MEELFEISLLLDFYGETITKKQYESLDLHYNHDYSLAEIADILKISRQGVHDNIKRGRASLYEAESKLKMARRHYDQKQELIRILELLRAIDESKLNKSDAEKLKMAQKIVSNLLED
jgi:predicted DNA-binding protein YlxM (UPF0122 family)